LGTKGKLGSDLNTKGWVTNCSLGFGRCHQTKGGDGQGNKRSAFGGFLKTKGGKGYF